LCFSHWSWLIQDLKIPLKCLGFDFAQKTFSRKIWKFEVQIEKFCSKCEICRNIKTQINFSIDIILQIGRSDILGLLILWCRIWFSHPFGPTLSITWDISTCWFSVKISKLVIMKIAS
jgi:hypothetical protein